jgi:hypothetical protein
MELSLDKASSRADMMADRVTHLVGELDSATADRS